MRGLQAATSFFSIIPVPPIAVVDERVGRDAIRWLPMLGLLLGTLAAAVAGGALWVTASPLLAAVLGLGLLALVTGGLHLDGIADTADGIGSRKPVAEALAVMKRSDIGPMGVASMLFVLLLEVAALANLAESGKGWFVAALVFGPAVARVPILEAFRRGVPMARKGGFGALFKDATTTAQLWVGYAVIGGLAAAIGWLGRGWGGAAIMLGACVGAWGIAYWWRRFVIRRFGGLTGDLCGSVIELTAASYWVLLTFFA